MGGVLAPASILVLGLGACVVHGVARLLTRRNEVLAVATALVYVVGLGVAVRLGQVVGAHGPQSWQATPGGALLLAEPGAMLLTYVSLTLGLLVSLYSGRYMSLDRRYEYYYPLLLLLSCGLIGMLMAADLFTLYLFTMLAGGASYVLVAFRRRTDTAIEAAFKYAIMGGTATILFLTGLGWFYRDQGQLALPAAAAAITPWGAVGVGLVLSGCAIKGALVPAHTWLPDAYGRAPSSISAFLSGIVTAVHLYVMVRAGLGMGWSAQPFGLVLLAISLANMTLGNTMALMQTYGKRLLAYSSIAYMGYIMFPVGLGLAYQRPEAISAGLYVLVAHAAMKGLAFLCKGVAHYYLGATMVEELDGFAQRLPLVGTSFVIALAGLAGVPPTAGFMGKWQSIVTTVPIGGPVVALGLGLLVLNSLLSVGYYLPLIGRILRRSPGAVPRVAVSPWMQAPIGACALAVLALGLWPGPLLGLTRQAAEFLLSWGVR
jgi:proton-translocating NADH-quinone oxidoreductase chain N